VSARARIYEKRAAALDEELEVEPAPGMEAVMEAVRERTVASLGPGAWSRRKLRLGRGSAIASMVLVGIFLGGYGLEVGFQARHSRSLIRSGPPT
jgi:hypothetical protein